MSESATVVVVTPEERAEREREGAELVIQATDFVLESADSYTAAATWLREVVIPLKRKITDTFRPRISQAHALHKGLCDDERRFLAPVEGAERVIKGKLATWDQEQTRRRHEAEAAAARERERLKREARDAAEHEQRRLQAAAETARLEEAAALEAAGDGAGAVHLIEAPIPVPVVTPAPVFVPSPPPPPAPKISGVSFREDWTAEVISLPDLVLAVASGQQPITLLAPNQVALNQLARALKGAMAVPGVRAVSSLTAAVRA